MVSGWSPSASKRHGEKHAAKLGAAGFATLDKVKSMTRQQLDAIDIEPIMHRHIIRDALS